MNRIFSILGLSLIVYHCCLPTKSLIAQPSELPQTRKDSIRLYYAYVDSAEICFICGEYANSVAFYQKAFSYHKVPFVLDLGNASVASKKLYAHSSFIIDYHIENSRRGRKYGYKPDEKGFNDSVKAIYDSTPSLVNTELREELITMHELDQGIRMLSGRMYDYLYNDSIKPIIDLIDSLNLRRILQLYQKYPLINEQTAGWDFYETYFWIILRHNNRQKKLLQEVFDVLKDQVYQGNIDARQFAAGYDFFWENASGSGSSPFYGEDMVWWLSHKIDSVIFLICNDSLSINLRRQEIFLNTYSHDQMKHIWGGFHRISFHRSIFNISYFDRKWVYDAIRDRRAILFTKKSLPTFRCPCER